MPDYLDTLAQDTKRTIDERYYKRFTSISVPSISLIKAINESQKNAVITEVKAASPSKGTIKTDFDVEEVASAMDKGGATGISVLTEPKHFDGSLSYLAKVRRAVKLPILMKDIIISPAQLDVASRIGANAILLIEALFERSYCEVNLDKMIEQAHLKNLEVLLETHSEDEFKRAIETKADMIGINNRDLRTLKVNLHITERILKHHEYQDKVIVSESGIINSEDLLFLRKCGAQAFLVGSSIMTADNIEQKVKELVTAH
jgi:indole-3-glycerol phosphate synthase